MARVEAFTPRRSSAAACIAACAWALFPAALLQELLVLKTALAVLCVLLAVLAVPWPEPSRHATWMRWSGAGAAVGAAALLRGEWLVLAPVLAFAAWLAAWRRWPAAPPRLAPVVMLAVTGLAVAVPALQNRARSGDWVLLAYGGGPNFYIGNRPDADGGYMPLRPDRSDPPQEEADAVALASLGLGHAASPAEVSRWWYGRGVAWWREAPLRALRLTGKKWAMLWGPWEMSDVLSTGLAAHWVRVLRDPLATPALWLPPALAGLWLSRRRRDLWPLHAALAAAQLAIVPFFLFERFRLPFVALALPFAALAATHAAALVAARHGRRLVVGTAVMLAARRQSPACAHRATKRCCTSTSARCCTRPAIIAARSASTRSSVATRRTPGASTSTSPTPTSHFAIRRRRSQRCSAFSPSSKPKRRARICRRRRNWLTATSWPAIWSRMVAIRWRPPSTTSGHCSSRPSQRATDCAPSSPPARGESGLGGEDLAQHGAGVRRAHLGDLARGSRSHDGTTARSAFRSQVEQPVGSLDDVGIVLDDEHRVALVDEPAENLEQHLDVLEVQARRRFVEQVERASRAHLRQLGRQLDALRLAARQVVACCPSRM
jgi:hypothetical protein